MVLKNKKVLLLGEYSAVHRYLKDGLQELGIEVTFAANTSGWRQHYVDLELSSKYKGIIGKLDLYLRSFYLLPKLYNHDVVQFIDYNIFSRRLGINDYIISKIIKNNKKSFLMATSCDHFVHSYYQRIKNPICSGCLKYDQKTSVCQHSLKKNVKRYNSLLKKYTAVIPDLYEYSQSYREGGCNILTKTLPLPVNTEHIKYKKNIVNGKIVIFHGVNRIGFKGTHIIEEALNKLKNKYPDKVSIVIEGKMTYNQYLVALERSNIVIDQLYNEGYGMNALISLAMGKVVLCANPSNSLKEINVNEDYPSINIQPTVGDIFDKLSFLIKSENKIEEIGMESRRFIMNNFHYVKVAEKYLKLWNSYF
jgi:glycosyltransferase involved in cell wall biosynthesis